MCMGWFGAKMNKKGMHVAFINSMPFLKGFLGITYHENVSNKRMSKDG